MKFLFRYFLVGVMMLFALDAGAQTTKWQNIHKVKKGETIFGIAKEYNVTIPELIEANPEMKEAGFELKKGNYVFVPFAKNDDQSKQSAQTSQPAQTTQKSQPTTTPSSVSASSLTTVKSNDGVVRVGVMLPLHNDDGDGRRMIEYYRGMLLALNQLKAEGIKTVSKIEKQTTINRYNNFGFRENWLQFYFEHIDTFFDNDEHGINKDNQMNPFLNWMRDSNILKPSSKEITEIGKLLAEKYASKPMSVWELIWINLTCNSEICYWYAGNIGFSIPYKKADVEAKMDMDPALNMYGASVKKNALGALQNAFVSSSLGNKLQVGVISKDNSSKPVFLRMPHNTLSLVAAAYSLYRYSERQKRYILTVSEFYDEQQKEGIYRQFGIDREVMGRLLLSLQEERNHVLRAELNMGLDNIILREDLTSTDILKMML